MYERRKKPTLEQIRTLYHFDVPSLAMNAGVPTDSVYHALFLRPISRSDAEKIAAALGKHMNILLSLDQLAIVTWEDYLLLWIVRASANGSVGEYKEAIADEYYFVYAHDENHAVTLASEWLREHPHTPYHYFTAYPQGFQVGTMSIPGSQEEEVHG